MSLVELMNRVRCGMRLCGRIICKLQPTKLEEVNVCRFVELKLGGEAILDGMKKNKGAWVFGLYELEELLVYSIFWIDKIKVYKIVSSSKVLMICECVFGFWDLWEVLAMQCFDF